jgi:hypothetical protein
MFGLWLAETLPLPLMIEHFLVSWRHLPRPAGARP